MIMDYLRLMAAKPKNRIGIVYSTDPDYAYQSSGPEEIATLPPDKQQLKLQLDKKARAGKQVTLITGFVGTETDLNDLAKALKNLCGTGGSAKDGEILIQGDVRAKVEAFLLQKGYKVKRVGG